VVQKAREVMLKVQTLRVLNGLSENRVPPFPVTEATPADSKIMVDAVFRDLYELRGKFNVTEVIPPAPLIAGKTPADVYADLQRASDTLDLLGVPRTMPRDVCRVAVMIVHDLDVILAARGRPVPRYTAPPSSGKVPADNIELGFRIFEQLRRKVAVDSSLAVPGGIVLPKRPNHAGPMVPADVLDLENNMLAELGAVKAALGVTTPTEVPPLIHGKTPSDTYDLLARALVLVEGL
jgi:hypothetical protein